MGLLSFIGGAAGGILAFYYFHRKIQVENILKERAKWRERIRELASQIASNPKPKDIAELRLRLNPNDDNDNKIIDLAESLQRNFNYFSRKSFLTKVARLLKHDWERAKKETDFLGFLKVVDEAEIRKAEKGNTDIESSKFCCKRILGYLVLLFALPWVIEIFFFYLKFVQCFLVN